MSRHRLLLTLGIVLAVALGSLAVDMEYQSAPWGWFIAWRWAEGGVSVQRTDGGLSIWTLGADAGRLWPPGDIPTPEPIPWPDVMIVERPVNR